MSKRNLDGLLAFQGFFLEFDPQGLELKVEEMQKVLTFMTTSSSIFPTILCAEYAHRRAYRMMRRQAKMLGVFILG